MSHVQPRRVRLSDGRMGTTTDPEGGVNGFVRVVVNTSKGTPGHTAPKPYPAIKVEFLEP